MRILQAAAALDLHVNETAPDPRQRDTWREAFLSNALNMLQPIGSFTCPAGAPPLHHSLLTEFTTFVLSVASDCDVPALACTPSGMGSRWSDLAGRLWHADTAAGAGAWSLELEDGCGAWTRKLRQATVDFMAAMSLADAVHACSLESQ